MPRWADASAGISESQLDLLNDEDLMSMAEGWTPPSAMVVVGRTRASRPPPAVGSGGEVISTCGSP